MVWELGSSRKDYEAFCANAADLPLCCEPWYLDAVSVDGDWGAATLLKDGELVAAWPYFHKQRWGLGYVTMPHFTKYMGIVCRKDLPQESLPDVIERLLVAMPSFDGLDQQFSPSAQHLVQYLPETYRRISYHTHQIQFLPEVDWRTAINRNMRRNIRKAEQQLRLSLDVDLRTFHEVSALSFERQGLPLPYTFDALERHDAALAQANARQIFAAIDEQDRIHSVAYLMWNKKVAYYHLSGDDPELRQSGSGIWLIAQALDFARNLGVQTFDFEGSMIPAIAHIREQFGAQAQPYSRIQMSRSALYSALKWWKQRR